ncbi:MAG TPA: hypothetical protein VMW83_06940, partial [Spirochaetia bacterium]|nr:hypothetical protein [Spirochaetia bacterium]
PSCPRNVQDNRRNGGDSLWRAGKTSSSEGLGPVKQESRDFQSWEVQYEGVTLQMPVPFQGRCHGKYF